MMRMREQQQWRDPQSRVYYELSSLVLSLLRSPPVPLSDQSLEMPPDMRRTRPPPQITPAGFASMLLGISVALMLCGSVAFFLGFMLMPWVIGLVMVLYVVGMVSTISMLGRWILCYATASPSSPPRKEVAGWKLL